MASSPRTLYLFAGDSLTEGTYGESYVDRVAKGLYQGWAGLEGEAINAGRSGDTVAALVERIDAPLRQFLPHWVVLAVGGNDAWFPWLSSHSIGWWSWLRLRRLRHGQKPTTDLDQFAAAYRALIDKAQQSGARVLVCTVSPVGENLASPVNRHLARLNGVLKHVAAECQVPVADVWQAFVEAISSLPKPSSYIPGEWLFHLMDRQRLRSSSADSIARRRRLYLTFDGVHLNSRGADLWAEAVLAALAREQQAGTALAQSPAQQLGLPCSERGPLQVCASPGWEARAGEVAGLVTRAVVRLSSLTGVQPSVQVAVLTDVNWSQLAGAPPHPRPAAYWQGRSGAILMPEAYSVSFNRSICLPEAVAAVSFWPPALEDASAPARATALADLLAIQALAQLYLLELQVAAEDPALDQLLAMCLAQVALETGEGENVRAMASAWNTWGQVLAAAGKREGQIRLQAQALYQAHGPGLVAMIVERSQAVEKPQPATRESSVPD